MLKQKFLPPDWQKKWKKSFGVIFGKDWASCVWLQEENR
jgi:hypothetical protein